MSFALARIPCGEQMAQRVFISHAVIDTAVAQQVAALISACDSATHVFVASRPGDIAPGQEWPIAIQQELRSASAYIVMLTPSSVSRPWVWFETGAAWMSEKLLIPILAGGLKRNEVPSPGDLRQLFLLDDPEHAKAILQALGLVATESALTSFLGAIDGAAAVIADEALRLDGWHGVTVNAAYYAWRGPLDSLEDRKPIPEPAGLIDALRASGQTPHWTQAHNLAGAFAIGSYQVFQTDRKTYRREIHWGDVVLTVGQTSAPDAA
jgi:TIR domain-containing protein